MPVPGLSLIGFMDRQNAIAYFRSRCQMGAKNPKLLADHWTSARKRLALETGSPVQHPGQPEVLDIPTQHQAYLTGVQSNPRFQLTVGKLNWEFKLVEIDPLLAFQVQIESGHAADICAPLGQNPELQAQLEVCLPHGVQDVPTTMTDDPGNTELQGSTSFESENANLRILAGGPIGPNQTHMVFVAGIAIGEGSRLVQVVELAGRLYLKNGFHRAYGLRRTGVTHIPCILLKGTTYADTGAMQEGTFPHQLLESANPPVLGHYTADRAYPVTLKRVRRIIKVSWLQRYRLE